MEDIVIEAKIDEYRKIYREAYRVEEVDRRRTADLVENAKGRRSIRQFASILKVNPSSISRILSGKTGEISEELFAKIIAYADEESIVTVDKLLGAQGLDKKENRLKVVENFETKFRSIVTDALLQKGKTVSYVNADEVKKGNYDFNVGRIRKFDFIIRTNAISEVEENWIFECKKVYSYSRIPIGDMQRSWLNEAMAFFYTGVNVKRVTIVVDEEYLFNQIRYMLSDLCLPDEVSVLLVSLKKGIVLNEYVAPLKDGRIPTCAFSETGVCEW